MIRPLLFLCALVSVLLLAGDARPQTNAAGSQAGAAPSPQYPMLDTLAGKVIQKYQQATCEQLWVKKSQPKPQLEQEAVQILRNDPQRRTYFINKVAAPIANKMFECGMIP